MANSKTKIKHAKRYFYALVCAFSCIFSAGAYSKDFTQLSQEALIAMPESVMIVDVRTPEEYAEGHVPGAVNIPLASVSENLEKFGAKEQEIVVYCRSGRRAGQALNMLADAGFENLYHLEGDIMAWEKAGREMAYPSQPESKADSQ
uniref:rhodanese-like domain-containing protein n=1 Tax=Ningiella ruwaisensis TaxID=2364274 RepID=UPI0010A0124A|nr:rhodanese-like domain-containing protein [Ningiella ruwaisensis]